MLKIYKPLGDIFPSINMSKNIDNDNNNVITKLKYYILYL